MKKIIVFLMLIICFIAVTPVKAKSINSFDNDIYVLKNNKKIKTTSSYISDEEVKKLVPTDNSMCEKKSKLRNFFDEYWRIIMICSPALVILMTILDFFKAITSSDSERIKKSANDAFKRTIAFIILLFLPFIINTIFGWFGLPLCL